jgi:tryptophan 2,3-dioxygenase
MPRTYWDYLQLPELLNLQAGFEADEQHLDPDELHFILVHQTMELWFKLLLSEVRLARDHLAAPHVDEEHIPLVVHHLRRIHSILELCTQQFKVVETLTPQDFLEFRDKLIPASGFQSFQLREIEVLLGLEDSQREMEGFGDPLEAIRRLAGDSAGGAMATSRIEQAREELHLRSALRRWLYRTPIQGSEPDDPGDAAAVTQFINEYLVAMADQGDKVSEQLVKSGVITKEVADEKGAATHEAAHDFLFAEDIDDAETRAQVSRVRAAILFIESYRALPLLAWPRVLIDAIVELEEQLVLFRTRHARMVERVIGRRIGTGGSSGVDYLDRTTRYRVFRELWAVRTILLPRSALPKLRNADFYGFADPESSSIRQEPTP